MKITIVNFRIRHKSKTKLEVIRNLVLDFILYFVIAHMRKYPRYATSGQNTKQNTLYIT